MKNRKAAGISLVALVITIIVLIILTGAVIVTFMEGGIIDRAKEAVFKNDIRTYQEILALKRAENQMEIGLGEKEPEEINASTLAEIQKIIPEFKEEYEGIFEISNGEIVLVEGYEEVATDLQEECIVDLRIKEAPVTDVVYNTGDEVTIGEEKFRVLKDNGSTLTLLTEKNITTDTYVQSASAQTLAFSNTNYWSSYEGTYPLNLNEYTSESIVSTNAIEIAKAYANKIAEDTGVTVSGRLMTVEEVEELNGSMDELSTSSCPTWINKNDEEHYINYWLGSAAGIDTMWGVMGEYDAVDTSDYGYYRDFYFGVRPVITISETAVN